MKYLYLLVVGLFAVQQVKDSPIELRGTWNLNVLSVDNDTVFHRDAIELTESFILKLLEEFDSGQVDTTGVSLRIEELYQSYLAMEIRIVSDSIFYMTKVRSPGTISPGVLDTGIYSISLDTLTLINRSRRNQEVSFNIDYVHMRLWSIDSMPEGPLFLEYTKKF